MNISAIVYTSGTGHTRQYAQLLGLRSGLPVYALSEAERELTAGTAIVYLGWIHASHVKGFDRAAKRFSVQVVCGVGLCDTGTMLQEVRQATKLPERIPLFTLQGGINRKELRGMDKLLIAMLTKGLAGKKDRAPQYDRMLTLLQTDASYVSEENLSGILEWLSRETEKVE